MDMKQDTTPLQLPQEIIDKVIDHLHDSPRDLKACSLVSHSFHPRSHFNFFQRVDVRSMGAAERFFTDVSPKTRTIIRSLTLSEPDLNASVQIPQIPSILQSLHLNHLVMRNIDLRLLKTSFSDLQITYLETQYCKSTSFSEFRSMLWSLPSLTTLIVFFPVIADLSALADRDDDSPSHKSILSNLTTTHSTLLSPLYLANINELHRLNISLSSEDHFRRFADIIQMTHLSLQHLSIEISTMIPGTPEFIVLGPLQTFAFKFHGDSTQWTLAWGMDILETNASNLAESLYTITFRHCSYGITATNNVLANLEAWRILNRLVELFPKVKQVHITFGFILGGATSMYSEATAGLLPNLSTVDNMIDEVTKALPKLAERGVLVIDTCKFVSWEDEAFAHAVM